MSDLTGFLLARIAEDIEGQQDQHGPEASHTNGCSIHPQGMEETWCDCGEPEFIVAEYEAKRRIVELHRPVDNDPYASWKDADYLRRYPALLTCPTCRPTHEPIRPDATDWPCLTLRLLALPYADHPNYRGEWKPQG